MHACLRVCFALVGILGMSHNGDDDVDDDNVVISDADLCPDGQTEEIKKAPHRQHENQNDICNYITNGALNHTKTKEVTR